MTRIYSNSFFHYTDLDSLQGILQNGFKIYFRKEAIYSAHGKTSYIGIPMTCFCDIPLSHLQEIKYAKNHVGIGMKRTWGIKHKLQPVLYYPNKAACQSTQIIIDAAKAFSMDDDEYKSYRILGFAKPFYDLTDKKVCNYIDREWRKIYDSRGLYKWKKMEENDVSAKKSKHIGSPLKFGVDDIDFIIINETDVDELRRLIMDLSRIGGKEKVQIEQQDRELLLSKVITYQTLIRNI